MIAQRNLHKLKGLAVFFALVAILGCKEEPPPAAAPAKSLKPPTAEALTSLPTVTLTGIKVQTDPQAPTTRVIISASGAFGANVIPKSDPERLIVILHNAEKGQAPAEIEVNDGVIKGIEIAQLNTGKQTAVRETIRLNYKTDYKVIPGESLLTIEIRK